MALLGKYCDRFYRDALIRRFIATDGVVLVGGRRNRAQFGLAVDGIEKNGNRGNGFGFYREKNVRELRD